MWFLFGFEYALNIQFAHVNHKQYFVIYFQYQTSHPVQQQNIIITPFLPSNQIPGAFRPIIPNEPHESNQQNAINLNTLNGQYHTEVQLQQQQQHQKQHPRPHQQSQHFDIIPSTPKPFYVATNYEQTHSHLPQQKYVAYVRPQQQYVKVVKTTPQPAIAAEDEQPPQYVPTYYGKLPSHQSLEHIPAAAPAPTPVVSTTRKPANIKVYKNSYKIHSEPALPQISPESGRLTGNGQLDSLFANIK